MVIAGSAAAAVEESAAAEASRLSLNVGGNRAGVIASDCGCVDDGSVEVFGAGVDDEAVLVMAAGGRFVISTRSFVVVGCNDAGAGCGACGG